MARPSKSVRVKTGAIASDVEAVRQDVEDKLRGENVPPEPPADLTDGQREIFQFIVSGLVASDILGQLDVFVLESTAVAIDRLRYINGLIDADPGLVMHTGLQNARAKYQSDLWRGCNELCLSPQARAKIGSLAAQKQKKEKAAQAEKEANKAAALAADDSVLLAALIQCEAGEEPYEGQVAVGAVVMNRVRSGAYPNTVKGVIYASGQFTPAGSGQVGRVVASGKIKASCLQAAQEAMAGSTPVGIATHFRRAGSREGIVIGHHVFW